LLEYKLPELGEDIESAEVINVYVSNGDKVAKDDPLFELETEPCIGNRFKSNEPMTLGRKKAGGS